jgi:hypothetical protein
MEQHSCASPSWHADGVAGGAHDPATEIPETGSGDPNAGVHTPHSGKGPSMNVNVGDVNFNLPHGGQPQDPHATMPEDHPAEHVPEYEDPGYEEDTVDPAGGELESPVSDAAAPDAATEDPLDDVKGPVADSEAPDAAYEDPLDDVEGPAADVEAPDADAEDPVDKVQGPVADDEAPDADAEDPVDKVQGPVADAEAPDVGSKDPVDDAEGPVARTPVLVSR